MLSGFKAFILRGNVIDLAVAVVIGAAFTAVVNTIVEAVFNPLIGALFNAESLATALPLVIPTAGEAEATIYFGAVIAAIIQFLLVAVVVYFAIVAPMNYANKLADARKPKVVEPEAGPTEAELLLQIRDLLAKQNS
ncbi:large conductance mechanosensitive channel [Salinibacterium amurskyense]|uniref:Large-conductance mechanosensitive channel n=1 Tax=Salinibacterium amurskyense TaxID=205941 RepID=A0A2M9D7T1_9MICO|nr:large conductance mechanosensitive channel protein MscL [Salinibacterium amurskyense]PJJ81761.1 large conductance mechanosensitive channel [Salinibacterium amurskyense]RLQ83735.1 large conductance mechanosensitive channel protein MscL [Salinibacterium amurskyense]GHD79367.1 large conductance mechanosensitive channel protein MscL [Salinibacterium amurskyense]